MLKEDHYEQFSSSLCEDGKASVRVGDRESEWFGVHEGVRQGCTLSPLGPSMLSTLCPS